MKSEEEEEDRLLKNEADIHFSWSCMQFCFLSHGKSVDEDDDDDWFKVEVIKVSWWRWLSYKLFIKALFDVVVVVE